MPFFFAFFNNGFFGRTKFTRSLSDKPVKITLLVITAVGETMERYKYPKKQVRFLCDVTDSNGCP